MHEHFVIYLSVNSAYKSVKLSHKVRTRMALCHDPLQFLSICYFMLAILKLVGLLFWLVQLCQILSIGI